MIADASQPSSFRFALDASAGITPVMTEGGDIRFEDVDGQVVATLPAPVISDADSGPSAESDAVSYQLERDDAADRWILAVTADRDWLTAPDRSWPVTIDPTVIAASSSLDCVISNGAFIETSLCASSGFPLLGAYAKYKSSGADEYARSLLRFNLSSIPTSAYVHSATLGLYAPSAVKNTAGLDVRSAEKAWTNKVNWKKYDGTKSWTYEGGDPGPKGAAVYVKDRGSQAGWWEFSGTELRNLVGEWTSGAKPNNGFLLKLTDEKNRECCIERLAELSSSAAAANQRPYLSVTYYLKASGAKLVSPSEGTRTARRLKLKAAWTAAGATGVTYQWKPTYYKTPGANTWQTIPPNLVKDASGKAVSAWPLALTEKEKADKLTVPLYFDARSASDNAERDGEPIYVRALFAGTSGSNGSEGYSEQVNAVIDPAKGSARDAVAQVGPGSLDLATGNFRLTATDVSIPGPGSTLEFARSSNSREDEEFTQPGKPKGGVLGAGWKPSVPVEVAGGAAWRSALDVEVEEGSYTVVTDLEGGELPFEWNGSSYVTPEEAPGWILSRQSATQLTLRDPSGGSTVFSKNASGSEYLPSSVSTLGGSGNTTQMVYEIVGGNRRLSSVIAATSSGVTCNPGSAHGEAGCRVLTFTYKPASTWGAPAGYGDRLSSITYWGPAPGSQDFWSVAEYKYNSFGRLSAVWDPRISPALKTEYMYAGGGIGPVYYIVPPGQAPWEMKYTDRWETVKNPGGWEESVSRKGWWRLERVSRVDYTTGWPPTIATTTIAYDVPISGSGAPYDLSGGAVEKWGQQDLPTDATAIFPPDEVPSSSPPSSYGRATVYYMDTESQLVNTATPPGAGTSAASISTTETDDHGNVVRELTPQNRLRALAAGSSSAEKSKELDTHRIFSADGTELQDEWGPLHDVRLESGSVVQARQHRTIQYDEGAPTPPVGTPMPHLPTRETTGASIPNQGTDADQRVTETKYDWTLRVPIETVADPSGKNIRTKMAYDATSALPISISQPSDAAGTGAGTTKIVYYSAQTQSPDSACHNRPEWASLPCKVLPAKQPGSAGQPELLVRRVASYSPLGQPEKTIESPGGKEAETRETVMTYDSAGRLTSTKQTGGGTAIPKTEVLYSSATGQPTTQRFACPSECSDDQATATTYDALGRVTKYQDADGNTAETTYDLLGRPVTISDGKGTQTMTYDATSGLLTSLQDSAAGTFTASYDADGNLVEQGLPNGLIAKTTYDEAGAPVHLNYAKATTWLDFGAERSIHGQILGQTSTLSTQQYSYDKVGRLTQVKDTPQGGSCTTRTYSYDKDSNREKLITRAPGLGGACDTTSTGTSQTYSYDTADRLLGTGLTYDGFGRITSLPGAYAGEGKALTTSYFSNNMVAIQTQGTITNTFQLDATGRQRQRLQGGGLEGTEVFHYSGPSDAPAWTERAGTWSRNIVGIGGELAAIQDGSSGVALQLTNLHGDVVATASLSQSATKPTATFESDEFGNPKQGSTPRFGWLGGKQRRTELPSGVIQMGVRSYVPAMGRFISVDPVQGGSASAYDYANADPVNSYDLSGKAPGGCGVKLSLRSRKHRIYSRVRYVCDKGGWPGPHALLKVTFKFERHTKGFLDEVFKGQFETKGSWEWKPSNPYDEKWRTWGSNENHYCGDIGREYQLSYTVNVKLMSPINGIVPGHDETFEVKEQVTCRR